MISYMTCTSAGKRRVSSTQESYQYTEQLQSFITEEATITSFESVKGPTRKHFNINFFNLTGSHSNGVFFYISERFSRLPDCLENSFHYLCFSLWMQSKNIDRKIAFLKNSNFAHKAFYRFVEDMLSSCNRD